MLILSLPEARGARQDHMLDILGGYELTLLCMLGDLNREGSFSWP